MSLSSRYYKNIRQAVTVAIFACHSGGTVFTNWSQQLINVWSYVQQMNNNKNNLIKLTVSLNIIIPLMALDSIIPLPCVMVQNWPTVPSHML